MKVPNDMIEDSESAGVSYLAALKRGEAVTAAVPGPVDVPKAADPSANSSTPVEKRRSPRYKCEGSAEMRELDCDVQTWATFTDISLHGCYVEAQATYPVGTVLYLKLSVNDFKVEAKGAVRVSYPYLGMGIAFMEMTEENHRRLKDLLSTLSHPSTIVGSRAASPPAANSRLEIPSISDPAVALQALIHFFQDRQLLTKEDFLRILRQSQILRSRS